jgi:hypothetical protein
LHGLPGGDQCAAEARLLKYECKNRRLSRLAVSSSVGFSNFWFCWRALKKSL